MPRGIRHIGQVVALCAAVALAARAPAQELCNDCIDDDEDGLVDCWDRDCIADGACDGGPLNGRTTPAGAGSRIRLHRLWASNLGGAYHFYAAGDIDADGTPEVVFIGTDWQNTIRVLDGATGALERELDLGLAAPFDTVGLQAAIADVDGDGTGEIFAGRMYDTPGTGAIARFEHDLASTYEFLTPDVVNQWSMESAGLGFADFNHDGLPEVYNMGTIYDPRDGRVLVDLGAELTVLTSSHSFAADIFPDDACALCAGLELVGSSAVWAVDVTTGAWQRVGSYAGGPRRGTFAVADWNGDGQLDVITNVNSHGLGTFDFDGELFVWDPRLGVALTQVVSSYGYSASVPLVADFDGDLELEVARLEPLDPTWNENGIVMRDHDLSPMWGSGWMENSSWCTGVMFDFDSDGRPDIAQRGTSKVSIFSGLDGRVLAEADCSSGTDAERVLVADLDGNGEVEILAGCEAPESLIAWTVEGSPPARQVMNQWQYYPFVVNDDLTVPCHQVQHGAPGVPPFLNASIQQAPLLRLGRTPAEEVRCPAPVSIAIPGVIATCGQAVVLDASGTTGCTTGRVYRWVDDSGGIACDWSPSPTCAVTPLRTTRYVLTAACAEDTWCHASAQVEVTVIDPPVAEAGPDVVICPGQRHVLDGRASTAACGLEYRWSDPTGVLRDFSLDPTFGVAPDQVTTYTLDVRCVGASACNASDQVTLSVEGPPVGTAVGGSLRASEGTENSVHFDWCRSRALGPDEHVHVYRSDVASASFALVAPDPHALDFVSCEWTDTQAPDALYFYDIRFATCTERITEEAWRRLP